MARTKRVENISAAEARTLALRAQGLAGAPATGGTAGVLALTRAVQLDTISVLARSHELVAYARLGAVDRTAVEDAYWGSPAAAFEYLAHANCILPADAWPYFAFRRRAWREKTKVRSSTARRSTRSARGLPTRRSPRATSAARAPARAAGGTGPTRNTRSSSCTFGARPSARLVVAGSACTTCRSARFLRALLNHEPSDSECYAYLVATAARALGVGTRRDIANYFLLVQGYAGVPKDRHALLDAAISESGLLQVEVEGWDEPAFVDPAIAAAPRPDPAPNNTPLAVRFADLGSIQDAAASSASSSRSKRTNPRISASMATSPCRYLRMAGSSGGSIPPANAARSSHARSRSTTQTPWMPPRRRCASRPHGYAATASESSR